jgi:hypothetical protein
MHVADLLTGWDTAILMAPFFGLLALWMFGLDERVTEPRDRPARRRFCYSDPNGRSEFCDPDGRIAKTRHPITPPPPYSSGVRKSFAWEPAQELPSAAHKSLLM